MNGQIQIDEQSLVVAQTEIEMQHQDMQRVEEGSLRYVTSESFRSKKKCRKVKWTAPMTDRFFDVKTLDSNLFNLCRDYRISEQIFI